MIFDVVCFTFFVVEDCTAGHGNIITSWSNITWKLMSLGSSPKGTLKPKKKRKFPLRTNPLFSKPSLLTTQPQLNEELRMKLQHCHQAPPKGLRQKWSPRIASISEIILVHRFDRIDLARIFVYTYILHIYIIPKKNNKTLKKNLCFLLVIYAFCFFCQKMAFKQNT